MTINYRPCKDPDDGLWYINRYHTDERNFTTRDTVYSNIPLRSLAFSLANKLNAMSQYEGN